MARVSLRRYDVQATCATVLALVSVAPVAVAVGLVFRNYRSGLGAITYREDTLYLPVLLACLAVAVLTSVFAAILGFNSAGQRRNEKQARSWIGFLVGGMCLTVAVVVAIAVAVLRMQVA